MHPRVQALLATEQNIKFKLHVHASSIRSPDEFAAALGCNIAAVTKTLLLVGRTSGQLALVILPTQSRLHTQQAALAIGEKRVSMAEEQRLLETLDQQRGSVSPVGASEKIPVLIDRSLLQHSTIFIGTGTVGEDLEIAPAALVQLCSARVADLVA